MADPETVTTTIDGRRYTITRAPGLQDGTVVERLDGVGLIGSERAWRGSHWAKTPKWYAALNRSGLPGEASFRVEGLASRKAAWRWLIELDGRDR